MSQDTKKKSNKLQVVVDILKKNNLITETISLGDAKFMVIILLLFVYLSIFNILINKC